MIYFSSFLSAKLIPPGFIEKLKTSQVQEGEPLRLEVRVSGEPEPEVTWYRDGTKIVSSPDFKIQQEGDKHTLQIPEAFLDDAGKISVQAVNPAGEATCTATLHVLRKSCTTTLHVLRKSCTATLHVLRKSCMYRYSPCSS